MGLVVDKGLHVNGDKWVAIVIVMAVHVCIGRDVGISLQLAKEKQLTFNLGEKLAPKMHQHGGQASAEYADHVVFERLDSLLGKVAAMVIGGDEFVCHLGEFNFGFVCKQCLVVMYLVSWDDATSGHLCKCATAGENEFAFAVILECLAPGGVGVHLVEDHDVAVAEAGDRGFWPIWSMYSVSFKSMIQMRTLCTTMCAVGGGSVTGAIVLGRFVSLVATGASTGQVY